MLIIDRDWDLRGSRARLLPSFQREMIMIAVFDFFFLLSSYIWYIYVFIVPNYLWDSCSTISNRYTHRGVLLILLIQYHRVTKFTSHIHVYLKINLVSNLFPDEDKWQAYFPEKKSREISKDLYEREERTNGRTKQYYKVINFRTAMGKRKQGSLFHAISNCSIFVFHFPSTVIRPINGEGAPGGCRSRPHM